MASLYESSIENETRKLWRSSLITYEQIMGQREYMFYLRSNY